MTVKNRAATILVLCVSLAIPALAQPPASAFIIDTLAGSDPVRDGGPAAEALFEGPLSIAIDAAGNIYIADTGHGMIRKIATDGSISRHAGTWDWNGAQEDQPADEAELAVTGMAFSPDGVLYMALTQHQIFRIDNQGQLRVVAGQRYQTGFSGDGGPASSANLFSPKGLSFAPNGDLYFADTFNHRVRKIALDGTISTVAGNGERGFAGDGGPAAEATLDLPNDVLVAPDGTIYIADTNNDRIRMINAEGVITTIAGVGSGAFQGDGSPALETNVDVPSSLVLDAEGNLVFGDWNAVRVIAADGTVQTLVNRSSRRDYGGDGGPAVDALISRPADLLFDSQGNLVICDSSNNNIRRVSPDGIIETVAGASHWQGDGGPANQAQLNRPTGAAMAGDGSIYIADRDNHVVRRVSPAGVITTVAGIGTRSFGGDGGPATESRLSSPEDVAIDPAGNLYIADTGNSRIRRVTPAGTIETVAGGGGSQEDGIATEHSLSRPAGLAIAKNGDLIITDSGRHKVYRVTPAGMISTVAGDGARGFSGDGGPATAAMLNLPRSPFFDAAGILHFADSFNSRIRRVASDGSISTVAEVIGTLSGAAIELNGNYLIANSNNSMLQIATPDGTRSTFVSKDFDFAGDGQTAGNAAFRFPVAVTALPDGRILVCDQFNNRVRVLTPIPVVESKGLLHAASFEEAPFSPGQIVTLFGWNLANRVQYISQTPLPTSAGGSTPTFVDAAGTRHPLREFFASPRQLNLYLADGIVPGTGSIEVRNDYGYMGSAPVEIGVIAPGLFSMSASGAGVAAAGALRVSPGGVRSEVALFEYNAAEFRFDPVPVNLGPEGDEIYLTLFGTGIRGRSSLAAVKVTMNGVEVPVSYAGEQGEFVGLDQVNAGPIPRSLAGAGEVAIVVTADGQASNAVTITVQ